MYVTVCVSRETAEGVEAEGAAPEEGEDGENPEAGSDEKTKENKDS